MTELETRGLFVRVRVLLTCLYQSRWRSRPLAAACRGSKECFHKPNSDPSLSMHSLTVRPVIYYAVSILAANASATTSMGRSTARRDIPPPPDFVAIFPLPTPPANSSR